MSGIIRDVFLKNQSKGGMRLDEFRKVRHVECTITWAELFLKNKSCYLMFVDNTALPRTNDTPTLMSFRFFKLDLFSTKTIVFLFLKTHFSLSCVSKLVNDTIQMVALNLILVILDCFIFFIAYNQQVL